MPKILVIYHTFGGKTKTLAEAAAEGAKNAGGEVILKEAAKTTIQDLTATDAILVATPQPFQIMAGETKKLFERLWKDREQIGQGKSLGVIVCYMTDATATLEAMKGLAKNYNFTVAGDWVTVRTSELEVGRERARQLGAVLAKGENAP